MPEHTYDEVVTPLPEKVCEFLRIEYHVLWGGIAVLGGAACSAAYRYWHADVAREWAYFVLGSLPGILILSIIIYSKMLERFTPALVRIVDEPEKDVINWYTNQVKGIFNERSMTMCGLVSLAIFFPLSLSGQLYPKEFYFKIIYITDMFILLFVIGGCLCVLVKMLIFVKKVGDKDIIISVHQHPAISVKAIGSLMGKIALTVIFIYLYGISYCAAISLDTVSFLCTLIFGGIILVIFIYPQLRIHQLMVKVKNARLIEFADYLEKSLEDMTHDPTQEKIQRVRELFDIQSSLNGMGEWPFDVKILLPLITGIAVPIGVVVVQRFLG